MTKKPWWKRSNKKERDEEEYEHDDEDFNDSIAEDKITDDYRFKENIRKKRLKERTFGNRPDDWEVRKRRPIQPNDDLDSFFGRIPFSFGSRDRFATDIEREFAEMRESMDRMLRQAAQGRLDQDPGKGGPFMYGYSMRTGPDGKPEIKEWSNMPPEMINRFRGRELGTARKDDVLPFRVERDVPVNACGSGSCNTCGPGTDGELARGRDRNTGEFHNRKSPIADVLDCGDHISVSLELPGVEKNEINLEIIDNELELEVNSPVRKFNDSIGLPCEVDPNSIDATFKNGVLNVRIKPKNAKGRKGKKINIK